MSKQKNNKLLALVIYHLGLEYLTVHLRRRCVAIHILHKNTITIILDYLITETLPKFMQVISTYYVLQLMEF